MRRTFLFLIFLIYVQTWFTIHFKNIWQRHSFDKMSVSWSYFTTPVKSSTLESMKIDCNWKKKNTASWNLEACIYMNQFYFNILQTGEKPALFWCMTSMFSCQKCSNFLWHVACNCNTSTFSWIWVWLSAHFFTKYNNALWITIDWKWKFQFW